MKVNIRELRARTKEVLRAVERGETVLVSSRGKICAKIVSVNAEPDRVKEPDTAYGMWKDHADHADKKNVKAYIDHLRKGRHAR